jgi:hypothetical protein
VISAEGLDESALNAAAARAGYSVSETQIPKAGYQLTRGSAL